MADYLLAFIADDAAIIFMAAATLSHASCRRLPFL
jgi:hypothetical protein